MNIMAIRTVLLLAGVLALSARAQDRAGRYVVFFRDKSGTHTPYSIDRPETFLSPKSLMRRTRQDIPVTEEDLPVNPSYVAALQELKIPVYYTLRWVNGALIEVLGEQVDTIQKLPFVIRLEYVAPTALPIPKEPSIAILHTLDRQGEKLLNITQLELLGLKKMYADSLRGKGITIAIMDAGFRSVNKLSAFADIFNEKRLTDRHDFVGRSSDVFRYHDHGTQVLSVMAANIPGIFRGGSPEADYQLYVTEEITGEYRVEEYHWMAAAERADSAGVDIIQSSVGYYEFDDPFIDYTTSQLDGKTSVISRAAATALSKGILVVNSAGNLGSQSWQLVVMPADVDGVIAVGGITKEYARNTFSSIGPTSDGRIKPDVTALGSEVLTINQEGRLTRVSGTSFASPSVASLAAGILQKYPDATPGKLYTLITNSGTRKTSPNKWVGYGTPSYIEIINPVVVGVDSPPQQESLNLPKLCANPVSGSYMEIQLNSMATPNVPSCMALFIYTLPGREVLRYEQRMQRPLRYIRYDISGLASGTYLVRIQNQTSQTVFRLVKQ